MPSPSEVSLIRTRRWPSALIAAVAAIIAVLAVTGSASAAAPANDNIANAQVIPTAGGTVSGTNVDATAESGEPRRVDFLDRPASTVWYEWTSPAQPAETDFDACDAEFHLKLALYKKVGDPIPPFGNLEDLGAVGEDPLEDPSCSTEYGAHGFFTPAACTTYYVQISGFAATEPPNGDRGPFGMTVSGGGSGACSTTPPPDTGSSPPPASVPKKKKKGASKKKCKKAKKGVASAAKKKKCKK